MSTLSIVILALKAAETAIQMTEGLIANAEVRAILDAVAKAIDTAVQALQPHFVAAAKK